MSTSLPANVLLAWHGDPTLKAFTLARLAAHRAADQLVKGIYWSGDRGCAVGCLTHDPEGGHDQYPYLWGIPEELAWLEDALFESLPDVASAAWPEKFLSAITPGADLSGVYARWSVALMLDPDHGNVTRCGQFSDAEAAVRRVGELWQSETVASLDEWSAASAAASAAWSAESAASASASAASASAESAVWSAASAVWSAASAVWSVVSGVGGASILDGRHIDRLPT